MRLLIFCLGFIITVAAQGQSFVPPKMDTVSVPFVNVPKGRVGQLVMEMPYSKSGMIEKPNLEVLKGKAIRKIQLIYTDYPKNAKLDQLNTNRLKKLYDLFPQAFTNKRIKWELVKQTDCKSQREANHLFHGLVIWYGDIGLASGRGKEIQDIEMMVEGTLEPTDSTILKVMDRHPDWDSILVIADLTGSMSPYVGQLLLWLRLKNNSHPAKYFVFFNDGDDKMNKDKVIGETGGIYTTAYTSMDSLIRVAGTTIKNGWGGDTPENNMEATIQGIKEFPDFKELVMITDNGAVPRDLSLLKKIKHPIKFILCGTKNGVNPIYLDIARRNKGSIHTIESDLEELMKMKEGEEIVIGEKHFKIKEGEFVEVKIEKEGE